jgi:uncharacterized OB-fold protein
MWQKIDQTEGAGSLWGEIPIHHRYTAGMAGERFFRAMKDEKAILASKCPVCRRSFLPPKMYCEECFERTTDWHPVEGPGYVRGFTVLHISLEEQPLKTAEVVGLIGWKGIEGGLVHRLVVEDPVQVFSGMAVEPVWAETRSGGVTDILYFREAGGL